MEDQFNNDDWIMSVKAFQDLFKNSSKCRGYVRDITVPPHESSCLLQKIQSHISIGTNQNRDEMPGINTSMHYIGTKGSYTPLHEEDGGLSSINLLKCGKEKVWLVIDYKWQSEVEKLVAEYLTDANVESNCNQILKHKIYFITPNLLKKWNIPYSVLVQKPGDLLFIRSGTYHAVVNTGRNIAEAINYGCDKWNGSYQPSTCKCSESNKSDVEQNKAVVTVHKRIKKELYQCGTGECNEMFTTKSKLVKHLKTFHSVTEKYRCLICDKVFEKKYNLQRHNITHSNKTDSECPLCKKKVKYLEYHRKNVHEREKSCPKCNRRFSKYALNKHLKLCNGVQTCSLCGKTFTMKSSFVNHMNVHMNK